MMGVLDKIVAFYKEDLVGEILFLVCKTSPWVCNIYKFYLRTLKFYVLLAVLSIYHNISALFDFFFQIVFYNNLRCFDALL